MFVSEETSPATQVQTDYGVFRLGGSVYSTGTEDVIVRVLDSATIRPLAPKHTAGPYLSPFNDGVYLLSPGPVRFIASNKQAGSTINLGTLPPDELVFGIRVSDCACYLQTGDASRNPDKLDHVSVRTFKSGPTELWFEDAPGPKGMGRSDRNFTDLIISVSGGVDNGAMADLVQAVQQQKGESREASITALKKINPKLATYVKAP